jgi:hypothetical protein
MRRSSDRTANSGASSDDVPAGWMAWRGPGVSHAVHRRANQAAHGGRVRLATLPVALLTADERFVICLALAGREWWGLLTSARVFDLAARERERGNSDAAALLELVGAALELCVREALPLWDALEHARGVVR